MTLPPAPVSHAAGIVTSGVIVMCDAQGVIVKVIHDGLALASRLTAGQPFATAIGACAGPASTSATASASRFMEALRISGFAFGWELQVLTEGRFTVLTFTGGATNDGVMIVGDVARSGGRHLIEELMRINNETVNALRASVKQAALSSEVRNARDEGLLGELSRANNDVITAQRELARKNAMLHHANAALTDAQGALQVKQTALEEANVRLDALATIDGLTEVKNRRAFGERLAEEIARSTRYHTALSLLLLDVDKFKQYNDSFGHLAGDEVLKAVARVLKDQSRPTEFVARYGGEEFAIVLPNTDAAGAVAMAERLRASLERGPWTERPVTASLGAATFSVEFNTAVAMIGAADRALYASKAGGRNRVTHVLTLPIASSAPA